MRSDYAGMVSAESWANEARISAEDLTDVKLIRAIQADALRWAAEKATCLCLSKCSLESVAAIKEKADELEGRG